MSLGHSIAALPDHLRQLVLRNLKDEWPTDSEFVHLLSVMRDAAPDIHRQMIQKTDPLHILEEEKGLNFDWVSFLEQMSTQEIISFIKRYNLNIKRGKKADMIRWISSNFRRDPISHLRCCTIDDIELQRNETSQGVQDVMASQSAIESIERLRGHWASNEVDDQIKVIKYGFRIDESRRLFMKCISLFE